MNEKTQYFDKYIQTLDNLEKDNNELENCYVNEENMNKYLNKKLFEKANAFKLDDGVFEFQAKKIFSEVYELKEKILYPFFSVEYSRNRRGNTIKLYYYKIEIKSDNGKSICFSFPIITNIFLVHFEEIPIFIEKTSDKDFLISVISKDFNHSIDFDLTSKGSMIETSFTYADIDDELFQIEDIVKETKNKIDSFPETKGKIKNKIKENIEKNKNNKIEEIPQEKNIIHYLEEAPKEKNKNNNNIDEEQKEKRINDNNIQENLKEKDNYDNKDTKEDLQKKEIPNKDINEKKEIVNSNNKKDEQKISEEKLNDNNEKNNNNAIKDNSEIKPEEKEIKEKFDEKKLEDNLIQNLSETEILQKKFKLYEKKLNLIKEKYSKENLKKELEKKKKELEILDLEAEISKDKKESERKILKEEIKKCEKLLQSITVSLKKKDQEFDGLFISKKEFKLENNLGDKITIPANRLVIVEVKNYINYKDIFMNLDKKKKMLKSIGFPVDKIFFVGILRNLDKERKEKGQLQKLDSENIIIIWANESTFLGVPLFEEKKEEKEEKEDRLKSLEDKMDKMDKRFQDLIQVVTNLSNDLIKMNDQMNNMSNDINYLKKSK